MYLCVWMYVKGKNLAVSLEHLYRPRHVWPGEMTLASRSTAQLNALDLFSITSQELLVSMLAGMDNLFSKTGFWYNVCQNYLLLLLNLIENVCLIAANLLEHFELSDFPCLCLLFSLLYFLLRRVADVDEVSSATLLCMIRCGSCLSLLPNAPPTNNLPPPYSGLVSTWECFRCTLPIS